MHRRSFLAALVAVAAAPRLIARLSRPETCVVEGPFKVPGLDLPSRQWFRLYGAGVEADSHAELVRMLRTRNEILDSLPWVDV